MWKVKILLIVLITISISNRSASGGVDIRLYGKYEGLGENISGLEVADLINHPSYPHSPSFWEFATADKGDKGENIITMSSERFAMYQSESPSSNIPIDLKNYGLAISGILYPPRSGKYTFHSISNGASQFFLSRDHQRSNMELLVEQDECCSWIPGDPASVEQQRSLEGGKGYYFEFLFKDGPEVDYFRLGWAFEDEFIRGIPIQYIQRDISEYQKSISGFKESTDLFTFPNEPQTIVVPERGQDSLNVDFDFAGSADIQWQINTGEDWENIEDEKTPYFPLEGRMENNGVLYRVIVNGQQSPAYTFVVNPDTQAPVIESTYFGSYSDSISLRFSEPVYLESALNPLNYKINGLTLPLGTEIIHWGSGRSFLLLLPSPVPYGAEIIISVSNIEDTAFVANKMEDADIHLSNIRFSWLFSDFEDGGNDGFELFGDAKLRNEGGHNDSAYLKLTDGVGNQRGSFLFNQRLGSGGGFAFRFMARIGDTSGKPADGFSFNFAEDIPIGTYQQAEEGYRGGETNPPEGLVVSFDNWDNGGTDKGTGIEVKYKGESRVFTPTPEVISGGKPTTDKSGMPSIHRGDSWFPVEILMSPEDELSVIYDSVKVIDRVDIGWEGVSDAQIGLGARTGGAWQSHWFDTISFSSHPDFDGECFATSFFPNYPKDQLFTKEGDKVLLEAKIFDCKSASTFQWFFIPDGQEEAIEVPGAIDVTYELTAGPETIGQYYVLAKSWFLDRRTRIATVKLDNGLGPEIESIVANASNNTVRVKFNESVDVTSASQPMHFLIDKLFVGSAEVIDSQTILLITSDQEPGKEYELLAQGVMDKVTNSNLSNSKMKFVSQSIIPQITNVSHDGKNITIDFNGILQSSKTMTGPWINIESSNESYTNEMSNEVRFYRVRPSKN